MRSSIDFKENDLEIMLWDKISVHKAAVYFGVCRCSIQQCKKSTRARATIGRKPKISTEKINANVEKNPIWMKVIYKVKLLNFIVQYRLLF